MTASEMKQYEGYYATTMGLLAIQPKGKTWRARCQGKDYQLLYHEGRWFSIPKLLGNIYLRFTRISGLPVVIAKPAICESEAAVIGEALFIEPLPEIWRKRCGKYRVVNDPFLSDVKIDLLIQDNILLFRTDDSEYPKMPLTPLSDNMAVTRGLGRKAHQTVRFEKMNGKEGIIFSGLKLEKI